MTATPPELERIIQGLISVLWDCRRQMDRHPGQEYTQKLGQAVDRIEAAVALLRSGTQYSVVAPDVENPVRGLPSCSTANCSMAAGAVVDGQLLCGPHASDALRRRRT